MKHRPNFAFFVFMVGVLCLTMGFKIYPNRSDADSIARQYVYKLFNEHGSCTGVQVELNDGKSYVLTAGHCNLLVESGKVHATSEDGKDFYLEFIAEDSRSDLMLLKAPTSGGLSIAYTLQPHQHVHTMTHGKGYPTYRTDGEMLNIAEIEFVEFKIESIFDLTRCAFIKTEIIKQDDEMFCAVKTFESITTSRIVPGSSGGPMLDDNNRLVGIASASGDFENCFVSLQDIKNFLLLY